MGLTLRGEEKYIISGRVSTEDSQAIEFASVYLKGTNHGVLADENGEFFDSNNLRKGLPENADAHGAYNIARKGGGCFAINKHLDNVCGNDNFKSY